MTGKQIAISVITPSYNQLDFLKSCCASVADQLGANVEHIVIDDASSDGTPFWLRQQQGILSISEADRGMYDAVNKGLRLARGDILAYLNCDEQYLPGTLAFVKGFFETHPEVDILFGDFLVVAADGSLKAYRKSIPLRWTYVIRYYGHYANAARGKRKKLGLESQPMLNIIDDAPNKRVCRKSWAQLIYQVYETDPLKCPKCGSQMKIIAFILEREEVIRILRHLKMWPIEYPKPCQVEARASPFDFKLLRKLSD